MNIGVIDQGFVGNAVYQEFKSFFKVYTYDIVTKRCNTSYNNLIKNCKIIFVCIPTIMNKDGSCNVELVREFMSKLNKETKALIVNKFTVFLGTVNNTLKSVRKTNDRVRKIRDWESMKGNTIN